MYKMTKLYVKNKDCDCKFSDIDGMKNTTLLMAHGFYMVYGCAHVTVLEVEK